MRNNYSNQQRTMNDDSYWSAGMSPLLMFLAGLGTGAALMYLMDPDRGRTRRALLRDQAVGLGNDAREAINATTEDLSNRAYGIYAETRKAVIGSAVSPADENQSSDAAMNRSNDNQTNETGGNNELRRSATQR
jgi:hypothetical protein